MSPAYGLSMITRLISKHLPVEAVVLTHHVGTASEFSAVCRARVPFGVIVDVYHFVRHRH